MHWGGGLRFSPLTEFICIFLSLRMNYLTSCWIRAETTQLLHFYPFDWVQLYFSFTLIWMSFPSTSYCSIFFIWPHYESRFSAKDKLEFIPLLALVALWIELLSFSWATLAKYSILSVVSCQLIGRAYHIEQFTFMLELMLEKMCSKCYEPFMLHSSYTIFAFKLAAVHV